MPLDAANRKQALVSLFGVIGIDFKQWQCGDSFFTKHSSCSFDRAACDPNNLLNPLHPSITPFGSDEPQGGPQMMRASRAQTPGEDGSGPKRKSTRKASKPITSGNAPSASCLSQRSLPVLENSSETEIHATSVLNAAKTREVGTIMPLSEVGKASRFGDCSFSEKSRCNVFEVVLQSRERSICPACARSANRARLPAYARGCFGLS